MACLFPLSIAPYPGDLANDDRPPELADVPRPQTDMQTPAPGPASSSRSGLIRSRRSSVSGFPGDGSALATHGPPSDGAESLAEKPPAANHQPHELGVAAAFQFCPRCGSPHPQPGVAPFHCPTCGWSFYFGPVAAVGGLIVNDQHQMLLVKRAREPGLGLLGLPGGFVDAGETATEALRREIREETGLEIRDPELLVSFPNQYRHCGFSIPVLDFFFLCRVEDASQLRLADGELSAYQWTRPTPEQLARMAFPSNRWAIEHWLRLHPCLADSKIKP